MSAIWPFFSKQSPCPACGHWDWSCRAGERKFICMRVASGHQSKDGGWYHDYGSAQIPKLEKKWTPPKSKIKIAPVLKQCGEDLSKQLGLSIASLIALGVGWSDLHSAWMFPMRNGLNEIVGFNRRFKDGTKKILAGTSAGLYIPQLSDESEIDRRVIYICEGGTDTCALLDVGLFAIGRFNCNSGADFIKTFCKENRIFRAVIVMDNDEMKRMNNYEARPGIVGALKLKKDLGLTSTFYIPPSPHKDIRAFIKAGGTREMIESEVKQSTWSKG